MKITVSGKNLEVGASLSQHVQDTIKLFTEKHLGDALESHVTISKPSHLFHTDIAFHVSHHFVVRAQAEDADAYRSCDLAINKVESRIHKYKSRLRDKRRHSREDVKYNAATYVMRSDAEDKGDDTPLIIAENPSSIETMSVSDAVMRLDLSDYPIFVFKHVISNEINVVYRRPDGHFGWVSPSSADK